jgi:hypothetical protein
MQANNSGGETGFFLAKSSRISLADRRNGYDTICGILHGIGRNDDGIVRFGIRCLNCPFKEDLDG